MLSQGMSIDERSPEKFHLITFKERIVFKSVKNRDVSAKVCCDKVSSEYYPRECPLMKEHQKSFT